MKKLKVLLVDDEIMIREGFKKLFDWNAHDCEVIGEAADGMEALTRIDTLHPDIVIMDINIPVINGLKVIAQARLKYPDTAFVIVSGYDDFSYCREALRLHILEMLDAEIEIAVRMYSIMIHNSTIGYEAANNYFFNKYSMEEKILCCEYLKKKFGK